MKRLANPLYLAAVTLIAAISILPQAARPDFNRAQTFDAQHYVIKTSFDRANKRISGETTVTLKPLVANFRTVELDAVGLSFESVKLGSGNDLPFTASSGRVTIQLDRAYRLDDTITITLKYTAIPKKGIYFVAEETHPDREARSAQIWTQGEPDEARHWFPNFDFPSDKATTEQYLTAAKGETVIANGDLLGKQENTDGTVTWHFKMPVPHSTYLVSFIIGDYVRINYKHRDIPLGVYVYPGKEFVVPKAFGGTKSMIRVFEELTNVPFPFNKYDQAIVAEFQAGGMENITATTYSDILILLTGTSFGDSIVTDLVSHELAHSWFGNLVTCRNWAELWLNEGFATFMESAYLEKMYGREAYLIKIRTDAAEFLINEAVNEKRHALYNLRAGKVKELFDNAAVTYHKGGAVLHMLREQVGDGAFWRGVNIYLNRHKFSTVESTDLKKAMEEASGQDLGWFFDQWVYRGGAPSLEVKQSYDPRSQTLKVTISQTQKADSLTPAVFRLPLDIAIQSSAGRSEHKVDMTKRIQVFSFRTTVEPTDLIIDADEKISLKRVKIR